MTRKILGILATLALGLAACDWSGALAILRRALPAAENDARLQSALARA